MPENEQQMYIEIYVFIKLQNSLSNFFDGVIFNTLSAKLYKSFEHSQKPH